MTSSEDDAGWAAPPGLAPPVQASTEAPPTNFSVYGRISPRSAVMPLMLVASTVAWLGLLVDYITQPEPDPLFLVALIFVSIPLLGQWVIVSAWITFDGESIRVKQGFRRSRTFQWTNVESASIKPAIGRGYAETLTFQLRGSGSPKKSPSVILNHLSERSKDAVAYRLRRSNVVLDAELAQRASNSDGSVDTGSRLARNSTRYAITFMATLFLISGAVVLTKSLLAPDPLETQVSDFVAENVVSSENPYVIQPIECYASSEELNSCGVELSTDTAGSGQSGLEIWYRANWRGYYVITEMTAVFIGDVSDNVASATSTDRVYCDSAADPDWFSPETLITDGYKNGRFVYVGSSGMTQLICEGPYPLRNEYRVTVRADGTVELED